MKLRLRSSESKDTLKIEAPNRCCIFELKQIISQTLPNPPSPASIRLSLNRKDELQSQGTDSLHSLGITAGDLIFYSLDHPAASTASIAQNIPVPILHPNNSQCSESLKTQDTVVEAMNSDSTNSDRQKRKILDSDSKLEETGGYVEVDGEDNNSNRHDTTSLKTLNTVVEAKNSYSSSSDSQKGKTLDSDSQLEQTGGYMEIDGEVSNSNRQDTNELSGDVEDKSFSVPGFLRKVFMEELGNDSGHDHKLIVIAVHAVLLESGFVGFDPTANMVYNGLYCPDVWPSRMFSLSLYYTLPEFGTGETAHNVVLKFQSLRKYIIVYGSLNGGGGGSGKISRHMVRLSEDQLVPFLNVVWANCGVKENINSQDGTSTSPEKEVFKFWRTVKDNLALPLSIDICEKAGLNLPPCFMRLPTDLKLKIMELLPGVDIAKVSCACSEVRYLASSDELWKLKFEEEFGKNINKGGGSWKRAFVRNWEMRKSSRNFATRVQEPLYLHGRRGIGYGRPPFAPQFPGVIGGDYDMWPNFGNNAHVRFGEHVNRLNFSPCCDFGRLDG